MNINKYQLISIIIFLFLFSITNVVSAAELFFEPKSQELGIGQEFQVNLMIDPQGKEINVISTTLSFPENLVEAVKIDDGNSILTLWVEKPTLRQGKISFAGIVPGGFIGILGPYEGALPGKVLGIVFKTKALGKGEINIKDAEVLLHDGLGTKAKTSMINFQFSVRKDIEVIPPKPIFDLTLPEPFTPEITKHPEIFEGKYFLVFFTTDKESGIDYYEVKEGKRGWQRAESPYLLQDQTLRSRVYVKAVDRAGNERIEVIEPHYPIKWYGHWWVWGIILLGIVVYVIKRLLWRNIEKRK